MQDLHVSETLPHLVALSETYMQIYEQQQWKAGFKSFSESSHLKASVLKDLEYET